jgi:hypothetical protein
LEVSRTKSQRQNDDRVRKSVQIFMFARRKTQSLDQSRPTKDRQKQTETKWRDVRGHRGITLNCANNREFQDRSPQVRPYH